tara:strand:+ start:132 stop:308 length:177 start_codon:yes stop_codon:yes gene_type:complete
MAGKETDLLRDPLAVAQQRYQEQIQAFKDQYIPRRKHPVREQLERQGISSKEWSDLFK